MSSTRPHASARLGERDPAELAKRVRKNHNLSALLLRLLDHEEWRDTSSRTREQLSTRAVTAAKKAGLAAWPDAMVGGGLHLTALGRQVAGLVSPSAWTLMTFDVRDDNDCLHVRETVRGTMGRMFHVDSKPGEQGLGLELVNLLNARAFAAAKVYQVKS